jgi:hypothetical protein
MALKTDLLREAFARLLLRASAERERIAGIAVALAEAVSDMVNLRKYFWMFPCIGALLG